MDTTAETDSATKRRRPATKKKATAKKRAPRVPKTAKGADAPAKKQRKAADPEVIAQRSKNIAASRERTRIVEQWLSVVNGSYEWGEPSELQERIDDVSRQYAEAPSFARQLELAQEQLDLEKLLERSEGNPSPVQIEESFREVAEAHTLSKRLSAKAWRRLGVKPAQIKEFRLNAFDTVGADPVE